MGNKVLVYYHVSFLILDFLPKNSHRHFGAQNFLCTPYPYSIFFSWKQKMGNDIANICRKCTKESKLNNMKSFILRYCVFVTAKRKLERLQFSTSSSFAKIWSACSCEFKAYIWTFWALYHLLFDLETIGVN